ncbi:MAG: acyltransferase family protein [Clostridiales bacterium]|nr:acyltransferase family protein [Clostridiales bacterium]
MKQETPQVPQARIEKWDLLRALLIFLVVLGHTVNYYTADSVWMRGLFLFINSFHMPCFLFLDGLFSKRNVDGKRYSRIFSLELQ